MSLPDRFFGFPWTYCDLNILPLIGHASVIFIFSEFPFDSKIFVSIFSSFILHLTNSPNTFMSSRLRRIAACASLPSISGNLEGIRLGSLGTGSGVLASAPNAAGVDPPSGVPQPELTNHSTCEETNGDSEAFLSCGCRVDVWDRQSQVILGMQFKGETIPRTGSFSVIFSEVSINYKGHMDLLKS